MAKTNLVYLYGRVSKEPIVSKNRETGEYNYGFCYVDTVRSLRSVGDDLHYTKHEKPMVLSQEEDKLREMASWKVNDIVMVKGVVHSQSLKKISFCPFCKDEKGNSTKNEFPGNLISVTPIYLCKIKSYGEDKMAAIEDVIANREISNQVLVYGTLLKDPKIFTTKRGVKITQYPIATNRKFTVRTDDPAIRTDYPWVKSYGSQAVDDKAFLHFQSEVLVDGYLQARVVKRKSICPCCGKVYEWADNCMEIAPYKNGMEYVKNFRTPEDIEAEQKKTLEEYKQMLFSKGMQDAMEEGLSDPDSRRIEPNEA